MIGRILRYMASEDMIDEVDVDTFAANKTCKWFATDEMDGAIHLSSVFESSVTENLRGIYLG